MINLNQKPISDENELAFAIFRKILKYFLI